MRLAHRHQKAKKLAARGKKKKRKLVQRRRGAKGRKRE